jgi:hypothetical protein
MVETEEVEHLLHFLAYLLLMLVVVGEELLHPAWAVTVELEAAVMAEDQQHLDLPVSQILAVVAAVEAIKL